MKTIRTIIFLLTALVFALPSNSQTFTNNTVTVIPNTSVDLMIPVTVSGLPGVIDTAFGLSGLCFNITHQYDANLRISLQSPDGDRITLVDQKGGGGQNFTGTCLAENSLGGWIMTATAPFSGIYLPQQSLNILNNSQDPNGTWYFIINDLFIPSDTGTFNSVSLTFSVHPPNNPVGVGPCSEANPGGCQCPASSTSDCDLLPDIAASPLSIIEDHEEFPGYVQVGVATTNIGWGPLEVHGIQSCYCDTTLVACTTTVCPNGQQPKQLVNQRVYHKNGNSMTSYDRPGGTMTYHPSHGHIHVDDWVYNSLRVWTPNPDPRTWPIIGTSTKISFCLTNLYDCDFHYGYCEDSLGNPLQVSDFPNANFGHVSGCTIDQGIYVGYADQYGSYLAGQEIYVNDACNETYYVVSIIDPLNRFLESKENNNWTSVPLTLSMQNPGSFLSSGFNYSVSGMDVDFSSNASSPDSCKWVWGDGDSSSITNGSPMASHMYSQPGTYVVYLYAYNHCGPRVSADTIQVLQTGMNINADALGTFEVYPNPSKEKVNISYTLINATDVALEVSDASGKIVKVLETKNQLPGKYKVSFDSAGDGLNKGVYTARLSTRTGNRVVRFIVL